ncbi:MAG: ABC transporter ATP-binding protein [Rhodospirillaceae bacterium]|nr:MAG: ABC transporter ATP-binding protein [Rhodospirillaceae bacterium]
MTTLAAAALHVRLGTKNVLQGVSATFAPGEVTAIIGPNGAGKSTLLACLAGLRRPDTGTVKLGDQMLSGLAPRTRAQHIGFLPQIPEVAWAVDVRTLVGLGRTPFIGARGLSAADATAVDEALSLTATTDLAHRNVATLSGGERTRVLLARALAGAPQWLLADEPLAGLDPGHQLDAAVLLRRLARQNGCGIIITLHDLHMALRAADRILVLAGGRILADGAPAQALSPAVLAAAYGIRAHIGSGVGGPVIEILERGPP